jgi:hypothetical protein
MESSAPGSSKARHFETSAKRPGSSSNDRVTIHAAPAVVHAWAIEPFEQQNYIIEAMRLHR